jgi:hypothetical protein
MDIRTQLQQAEDQVRRLRQERNRLNKLFQSAQNAVAENETDATMNAAMSAKEAKAQVERQLEVAQDEQVALLARIADAEAGRAGGLRLPFKDGWAEAARRLDLAHGETRVDLAGSSLLQRPMAQDAPGGFAAASVSVKAPPPSPAQDRRFAYRVLRHRGGGGRADRP